jgi:hypothetical protein
VKGTKKGDAMKRKHLGDQIDARVAAVAERIIRTMTRRDALRTAVLGGTAGIAALALGQRPALAVTCYCGPTIPCARYHHTCPSAAGCPPGYIACKNSSSAYCSCDQGHYNWQGYCCEWASGNWIACSGLGDGYGYKVCSDCLGPARECTYWCTCLSSCICCDCKNEKDVRAEQERLAAAAS